MAKVAPSVSRTVYPLGYDKNNKTDESFNNWAKYISDQVTAFTHPSDRLVIDAKKILNKKLIKK